MGAAIVLLSYSLEPLFEYLHRRRKYDQYKYLEWTSHSVLQLQRQGHEALGLGTWEKCIETVPITQADEIMGVLDITDGAHPLLRHPYLDGGAPGEKLDESSPIAESVDDGESTDHQAGGQQGSGELCTDQATSQSASLDNTRHGGGNKSLPDDMAVAPSAHTSPPENIIAAPTVHKDQTSATTADTGSETTSK